MMSFFLCAMVQANEAEKYTWHNVTVGAGGFAPNIIFSTIEKDLAYLRTDMGGAYRWDNQQQRWLPLQDGQTQSNYFGIESIALDPNDADVVYVAAGMYYQHPAAIMRSDDRGEHWQIFPVPFRMGGNEGGRGLGERLIVDPNNRNILYFGSRHDGLFQSKDRGETWQAVNSFPYKGQGKPKDWRSNAGISFVIIDPTSKKKDRSSVLIVGVADKVNQHLYQSVDGGETWQAIEGEPEKQLLPVQAALDSQGVLYLTYSNDIGPNGIIAGAVYKWHSKNHTWTNISPVQGDKLSEGGYMGISLDQQNPDTLVVATINRWKPYDTLWRSIDAGKTWTDLYPLSRHNVEQNPYLKWGNPEADFGWWMAGVAINPFDANHLVYTTGATLYSTKDIANKAKNIVWQPWTKGIEQTAIITLNSLPKGPLLLSGFGDISGFSHENLSVSPSTMLTNPVFANTNTIDYAGKAHHVVVRSGTHPHRGSEKDPTLAYSLDFGRSWQPVPLPEQKTGSPSYKVGNVAITTSADGQRFIAMTPVAEYTDDHGKTWQASKGLPLWARPVADRVAANSFYALDFVNNQFLISDNMASSFQPIKVKGLPRDLSADQPKSREAAWPLMATPDHQGDLWFVSTQGLYHSVDAGQNFNKMPSQLEVLALSFGKAPEGKSYPTLFAIGIKNSLKAIWRSDDQGLTWLNINGEQFQYGQRFRCIAGDPRNIGRVYVGTDGRGIIYGQYQE